MPLLVFIHFKSFVCFSLATFLSVCVCLHVALEKIKNKFSGIQSIENTLKVCVCVSYRVKSKWERNGDRWTGKRKRLELSVSEREREKESEREGVKEWESFEMVEWIEKGINAYRQSDEERDALNTFAIKYSFKRENSCACAKSIKYIQYIMVCVSIYSCKL